MNSLQALIATCVMGFATTIGSVFALAQSSDVHCLASGRGTLPSGDRFFGHFTIKTDFTVEPGGTWRHFQTTPDGTLEEVLAGIVEEGICIRNGRTNLVFAGIGRFTGRPVEFRVNAWDGATDSYTILITDTDGFEVYVDSGDLMSGDISAVVPEP